MKSDTGLPTSQSAVAELDTPGERRRSLVTRQRSCCRTRRTDLALTQSAVASTPDIDVARRANKEGNEV